MTEAAAVAARGVRKLIFSFIFRGGAVTVPSPRRGHRRRWWRRRGSSSIGRDDEHAHRPATTPTNPALHRRSRLGGHRGGEEKARASPPPPPAPSTVRRPSVSLGRAYRSVGGDPSLSCLAPVFSTPPAPPVGPSVRSPHRAASAQAQHALSAPDVGGGRRVANAHTRQRRRAAHTGVPADRTVVSLATPLPNDSSCSSRERVQFVFIFY